MEYMNTKSMFEQCFAFDNTDKCLNMSEHKNGFCINHQQYMNDITKFDEQNEKYGIKILQNYLHNISNESCVLKQKIIIMNMYEFLLSNKRFICTHKTFSYTVFNKLIDLSKQGFDSTYYLYSLFPYYK